MTPRPKREQAIELLAVGHTKSEVATKLEISRNTLAKWGADEHFVAAVQQRSDEVVQELRDRLRGLGRAALNLYSNALKGQRVTVAQIKAASEVLRALRVIESNPEPKQATEEISVELGTIAPPKQNENTPLSDTPTAASA